MKFKLHSPYQATGDQPQAIKKLTEDISTGKRHNTLLGVTGSGKTFTMANVIANVQKPTLVIAHNKTLAAQLYQEFRDFFPENAVSYFVSYYDYYQPEAYIPTTDTYIEKEATINDEIDKLRLASTTNLMTRNDVIVIASVSCIYNLGSPVEYGKYMLELIEGELIARQTLLQQLANMQYERADHEFHRGSYRIRGDVIQLWPAYEDKALRIDTLENKIESINWIDPVSGNKIEIENKYQHSPRYIIYPAKHYMMNPQSQQDQFSQIEQDLALRLEEMKKSGKVVESYRLEQKIKYDLEMMKEFGFVNGIENYSRYFDGRDPGDPPFTLLDYFAENARQFGSGEFLTIIDESHMTLPQIKGMHHGDRSRKQTLIEYGFRLPSALDNRPLDFDEFLARVPQVTYVSATPADIEVSLSENEVVEQIIRPTGLVDPIIELRPIENQIEDLVIEVINRKNKGQRTLVTTLTKKMAEVLTDYLNDQSKINKLFNSYQQRQQIKAEADLSEATIWSREDLPIDQMEIGPIEEKFYSSALLKTTINTNTNHESQNTIKYPKVAYLHSDIETLERSDILDDLRKGVYDVLVGINLLREGLDLPEVTLVAILDADKEGFLRSETSMVQTMGRAARHVEGRAILYADRMTKSMRNAINETQRRREIQIKYNFDHGITPQTISKPIRERMIEKSQKPETTLRHRSGQGNQKNEGLIISLSKNEQIDLEKIEPSELTPRDKKNLSAKLNRRMNQAAKDMDFELAAIIRDKIKEIS